MVTLPLSLCVGAMGLELQRQRNVVRTPQLTGGAERRFQWVPTRDYYAPVPWRAPSATFSMQRGLGGTAPGDRWHRAPEANLGGILNFKAGGSDGTRVPWAAVLTHCLLDRHRAQLRHLTHVGMEARLQGSRGACSGLSSAPTSRSTSSPEPRELPRWGGAGRGLWQQSKWEGLSLSRACLPGYLGSPHTASQAPLFLRCGWHHVLSSVCLCPSWGPHPGPGGGERECFKCPLMVFCRNKCSRFRVDPSLSPQVTSFWVSVSESPLPLPRCLSPSVSPSPSTEEWEAALGQQGLCCSRYLGRGLRALAAGRLWASCPGRGELAFPHPAQRLTRWRLVGTEKA